MLGVIRQYEVLRVIVAFPLDANFQSTSQKVQEVLTDCTDPLAKLSQTAFSAALVTFRDGKDVLDKMKNPRKRARGQLDQGPDSEAEDDRPKAKKRGGVERPD